MARATAFFCPDPVIDSKILFELEELFDRLAEAEDPPDDGTP